MTDTEIHSIFGYTTNFFYYDLNLWLRAGTNTNKTAKMKQLLNGALAKLPQWNGNIAYRGIKIKGVNPQQEIAEILAKYQKGASVPHGEFTSIGSSQDAAFINSPTTKFELRITLKTKTKTKDISDLADGIFYRNNPKHELLFPTDTNLYVNDVFLDQTTDRTVIVLFEQ